jgi:hemoglobin/transferrin/lactoferrin receptor protein
VQNDVATARWIYGKPDDRLFNFDIGTYWTRTGTDQTKLAGALPPGGIGFIGDTRNFTINTVGFDANNTSRFDFGGFRHALTYGVDAFQDRVDTTGFGVVFTPSGERAVGGGFMQLKSNYSSWLEVISAVRYDSYRLEGGGVSSSGDRVSPKITVGLTPVKGITPYVTYAEGYRAPAITETLIAGIHPVAGADFQFLPNPGLKAETGKNKEVGVNFRFDNVFAAADTFRAKANLFRNDVDNYIFQQALNTGDVGQGGFTCTQVAGSPFVPDCLQYQNIASARLQGFEFESVYDAGGWFAGFNYSHVKGTNETTGAPLSRIPPDAYTTTLGVRMLDRRLTAAVRWQYVEAKLREDISPAAGNPDFPPTAAFNLINLYLGYQINPDVLASLVVENLFDEDYSRYMTYYPGPSGGPPAPPVAFPQPGITVKGALQIKFGENFFKRG